MKFKRKIFKSIIVEDERLYNSTKLFVRATKRQNNFLTQDFIVIFTKISFSRFYKYVCIDG